MAADSHPPRFVLTGPSGWIGRAMLAHIERSCGSVKHHVTAFGSNEGQVDLPGGGNLPVRALETIKSKDVDGAHVIHLAYLTKEKAEKLGERDFTATNVAIDDALLGALRGSSARSLFVASSGAAAMAADGRDMHPYGLGKLRQEARFLEWARQTETPTIVGRIFNIAGPWINKLDAYALSNFAVQALNTGRIEVRANRPVFRSFLHVDDLCALVVKAAKDHIGREQAIDLCGAEVLEMQQIADAVALYSGRAPVVERIDIESFTPSIYLGCHVDTKVLAMQLGISLEPFDVQVKATLAWIESLLKEENASHSSTGDNTMRYGVCAGSAGERIVALLGDSYTKLAL